MFKYGFSYLLNVKLKFFTYIIVSYLIGSTAIIVPLITGNIINIITDIKNSNILLQNVIILSLIQLTQVFLQYLSNKMYIEIQARAAFSINCEVIHHIQKIPLSISGKFNSTYLTQRVNNDSNLLISFIISFSINVGLKILMILICVVLF